MGWWWKILQNFSLSIFFYSNELFIEQLHNSKQEQEGESPWHEAPVADASATVSQKTIVNIKQIKYKKGPETTVTSYPVSPQPAGS